MKERNLPNSVFVDCTSSPQVARLYKGIMEAGISVVTPNKKANSGSYRQYVALKETAVWRNVRFLYETNVGAGLPVINTLNDLVSGGDRVLRIEGVLSGTLGVALIDGKKRVRGATKSCGASASHARSRRWLAQALLQAIV